MVYLTAYPAGTNDVECGQLPGGIYHLKHAEIYDCPDHNYGINVPPLPRTILHTAGKWLSSENKVLVCGGLDCFSTTNFGSARAECFSWDPYSDDWDWRLHSTMFEKRAGHILADYNDGGVDTVLAIGGKPAEYNTEILRNGVWERFDDLPPEMEFMDDSRGCLVQDGDKVYSVYRNVTELDLTTWTARIIGPSFISFSDVGYCAIGVDPDGYKGIVALRGNFFRFDTEEWTQIAAPPMVSPIEKHNLVNYRGIPTIFGMPYCTDGAGGVCFSNNDVWQYDNSNDTWVLLENEMMQDRVWHTIVEIPRPMCDRAPKPKTVALLLGGVEACAKGTGNWTCPEPKVHK